MDLVAKVENAVGLCRAGDWEQGLTILGEISKSEHSDRSLPATFYSYLGYGIARSKKRYREAVSLCRHAVRLDAFDPEHLLNLARVYLLMRDRRRAVRTIRRGLKVEPGYRELRDLREQLGIRRRPVIPFLSRDNLLNRYFGKLRARMRGELPADERTIEL